MGVGMVQGGWLSEDKQPPRAEAAPGFQFSGGSLRRGTLAVLSGWASPRRYLATPPQGHPGASRCPQAIEVSAVLASLKLIR